MAGSSADTFVVLDVGGTTVSAALVVGDDIIGEPVRGPSRQDARAGAIVRGLAAAIDRARAGRSVLAAVVAIPAPFDYVRGVSGMEHKFASLRGVDLGTTLRRRIGTEVHFVNDAEAASIGNWIGHGRPDEPVATITLGTGVGSGVVVGGDFTGYNDIWRWPYGSGIVENHVSSGALTDSYARRSGRTLPAAEIAVLADAGDEAAAAEFARYGSHLGAAAAAYFGGAAPTIVSCTGGLTGAWRHIEPAATAAYRDAGGVGRLVRSHLSDPALVGGAEVARRVVSGRRPG